MVVLPEAGIDSRLYPIFLFTMSLFFVVFFEALQWKFLYHSETFYVAAAKHIWIKTPSFYCQSIFQ